MTTPTSNTATPHFPSAPDSCMMDEPSNPNLATTRSTAAVDEIKEHEGGGDAKAWVTLNDGFQQVQSVLDRNRVLIQQVNQNHRSRLPDNMLKNVALIQEINANICKIVSLYSDLSTNFSSVFRKGNE